jgi:hypothetical protein
VSDPVLSSMEVAELYKLIRQLRERAAKLDVDLARAEKRYKWCANELLACDYGDNDTGAIGWIVYGWRDRTGQRRIYGRSINEAVDSEIP